jgi:hypothetical protein
MRPDAEAPPFIADEVGMIVGDAAVVDGLVLAGVEALLHGDGVAIPCAEQVARLEQTGICPVLAHESEQMFTGGADQLAAKGLLHLNPPPPSPLAAPSKQRETNRYRSSFFIIPP